MIECGHCGTWFKLPARGITAICPQCRVATQVTAEMVTAAAGRAHSPPKPVPVSRNEAVAAPNGPASVLNRFLVFESRPAGVAGYRANALPAQEIRIEWRWYTREALVGVAFMALFDLVLMAALPFAHRDDWPQIVVMALSSAVFTYAAAAMVLNRTRVTVANGALSVEHVPLRLLGAVSLQR